VPTIAFFDVDETLLATKSMFDFLRFRRSAEEHRRATDRLGSMARAGVDRVEINRAYYRLWAGEDWAGLMDRGRAWYAEIRSGARIGPPFIASTFAALGGHREAGHLIALMSGSFLPCLRPLADDLGVEIVLCTHPEVDSSGRLTGNVRHPMIGRSKGVVVHATARRRQANLTDCHAYADHASDLAMLRCVGHPNVVGTDPVLLAAARAGGWPVLSAEAKVDLDPASTEPVAIARTSRGS
jgi:HAD superfamily hydrolase (TIGR01490 family)